MPTLRTKDLGTIGARITGSNVVHLMDIEVAVGPDRHTRIVSRCGNLELAGDGNGGWQTTNGNPIAFVNPRHDFNGCRSCRIHTFARHDVELAILGGHR